MSVSTPYPFAVQTKLDTAQLSGRSVAFCLPGPLGCGAVTERYGFFFADGPRENAIVLIALPGSKPGVIRLWREAVDSIQKAEAGRPYEFTCYIPEPA